MSLNVKCVTNQSVIYSNQQEHKRWTHSIIGPQNVFLLRRKVNIEGINYYAHTITLIYTYSLLEPYKKM